MIQQIRRTSSSRAWEWTVAFRMLFCLWSVSSLAQAPTPAPQPTGAGILALSLNASGAANSLNPVQGFTANGTITYFWSAKPVQAPATIRARGRQQFRLDATLPAGIRSIAINGNSGARKEETGKLTPIPMHNTVSMGESTFPYLSIAAALTDPAVTISYVGSVQLGTQTLRQVRITRNFPAAQDPKGIVAKLSQTDYFVDSQTNLVVKTTDFTHPIETLTRDYLREVSLESYKTINGIAVPTLVREKIAGQKIWEFSLQTITFNTTLTDTDFTLQ